MGSTVDAVARALTYSCLLPLTSAAWLSSLLVVALLRGFFPGCSGSPASLKPNFPNTNPIQKENPLMWLIVYLIFIRKRDNMVIYTRKISRGLHLSRLTQAGNTELTSRRGYFRGRRVISIGVGRSGVRTYKYFLFNVSAVPRQL